MTGTSTFDFLLVSAHCASATAGGVYSVGSGYEIAVCSHVTTLPCLATSPQVGLSPFRYCVLHTTHASSLCLYVKYSPQLGSRHLYWTRLKNDWSLSRPVAVVLAIPGLYASTQMYSVVVCLSLWAIKYPLYSNFQWVGHSYDPGTMISSELSVRQTAHETPWLSCGPLMFRLLTSATSPNLTG